MHLFTKGVTVMKLPYYAARANLSYLLQQHPDWTHAQFAAALGYSKAWVKKWRARLREELAAGLPLEQIWQGHSRARKHLPRQTHPLVVEQILAIRDQPPEGLRRVPDQEGKRQHVVETLNIIDTGTSVLLDAHVRADFTAETALEALASTLAKYGCPKCITLDRDPRWVGSPAGSDFPAALVRFGACLGIEVQICDPQQPQQNSFVERYHRTYQA